MGKIHLELFINAPPERCFDLCRSVDVHVQSTEQTQEKVVAGVMAGLMNNGDTVTWEARHFGIRQRLQSQIIEFNRPYSFTDVQVKGIFHSFSHQHIFESKNGGTLLKDVFIFKCPFGILGHWVADWAVEAHLKQFLILRNQTIKELAEGDGWKAILNKS